MAIWYQREQSFVKTNSANDELFRNSVLFHIKATYRHKPLFGRSDSMALLLSHTQCHNPGS